MYIIAIAWTYVALMAAITEPTVLGGIITFIFWGVLPVSIILFVLSSPARKQRRKQAELADEAVHHPVGQGDGADAKPDE